MSRILVYTSPARGHLYPLIPTLLELQQRGQLVSIRTLAAEVETVRALGFAAAPIDPAVEARTIDDWQARSAPAALLAACRTFIDRGNHEIGELRRVIKEERPDALFIDVNSWGAAAAAEMSGLPWATFAPYFLPFRAPGLPPWGLGLAPLAGPTGRLRDAALWRVVNHLYDRALPGLNRVRASAGALPLRHVAEAAVRAPRVVYYTAEPFEYPRQWPSNITMVGPGIWEKPDPMTEVVTSSGRPLVLVTCSTEFQNDGAIVAAALDALGGEDIDVVATTASVDPARFTAPANAHVERYMAHGPLLRRAACVVCHGGMGITQKALSAGVPVCAVPFGRDQIEVARHVVVAGAGAMVKRNRLTAERLRTAVRIAMGRSEGARRVAEGFRRAGGPRAAADALESILTRSAVPIRHVEPTGV